MLRTTNRFLQLNVLFLGNLRIHSVLKLGSKVLSDGLKHLEIKNANITHSYDGRVTYSMTNLFRRNPEVSKLKNNL